MKYCLRALKLIVAISQKTLFVLTMGSFPPPFVSTNAVIRVGDRILLIDRRDGLGLSLPGGFVGMREAIEDALKREVKEETGLTVELGGLITVLSGRRAGVNIHAVALVYEVKIIGSKATRDSFEGKCRWIDARELHHERIALDHIEVLKLLH